MSFVAAIGLELFLGFIGIVLLWLQGATIQPLLSLGIKYWLLGIWSAGPVLAAVYYVLSGTGLIANQIRSFFSEVIGPIFKGWNPLHFLLLSLASGIGEEILFRGAIQGWLTLQMGAVPGIVLTGLLFGILHAVRWWYFAYAIMAGWYLGWLMVASGTLLVPALCHATLNFVTLAWFSRLQSCSPNSRVTCVDSHSKEV